MAGKLFAVFAVAILVTVSFSQLVGTVDAPPDEEEEWRFEEDTRRLTVAEGASDSPQVGWSPSGALHLVWADTRDGSVGAYYKASEDAGLTFTGDRPLASGFFAMSASRLAIGPGSALLGVAWEGRPSATSESRVYVRANSDSKGGWGRTATLGAGRSPALAATEDRLILAYVHPGFPENQVRVVSLGIADGAIRDSQALLAFNSSASSLALVVSGGRAHLAWGEEVRGVAAIAHVSITLSTGRTSPVHLITATASSFGGIALVGRGDRLALAWSDNSVGSFDIHGAFSGTAGETWVVGPPIATGPGDARAPAAAVGARELVAVVWEDDRLGTPQVFGRTLSLSGTPSTRVTQVSASPAGASDPSVSIGPDRDLVVAWSDARHGPTEVYADLDALMDRPRLPTLRMYTNRLAREDFAPPARVSRAELLELLAEADSIIERREESRGIAHLEGAVMTRFDGALGGDPADDLVINATAQAEMTRLVRGLVEFLRGPSPPGTRADVPIYGAPAPPPPGLPSNPTPQPIPGLGAPLFVATISSIAIADVTGTSAVVGWAASAQLPVSASFVDWGTNSTSEHRTWDNTTPYEVLLTPLLANRTYRVQLGAIAGQTTTLSDNYSFFTGVQIANVTVTNVTDVRGTLTWTTNLPSTSEVRFGTNESNLVSTATGPSGLTHQVNVTGLSEGRYYYRVRSVALSDALLVGESGTAWLETSLRLRGLARSTTHVAGYYNVTFAWTTAFQGTTEVRYGLNETLSQTGSGSSGTSHALPITNLRSNSTYLWQVCSKLVAGSTYACVSASTNTLVGKVSAFGSPEDAEANDVSPIQTPPIAILGVTYQRGSNYIHAKWNTTYRSNAVVMWWQGTGSKTVQTVSESTLVHSVNVSSGLASATTYKVQLNSTATANAADIARTSPQNVTTKGIAISGASAWVTATSAAVNWSTGLVNGTSVVDYGIGYCQNRVTGTSGTGHSVLLTGLRPETTYTYCVTSASTGNPNDVAVDRTNPATGLPRTFTTLVAPNDANSSTDAGGTFGTALPLEPGRWKGWVNLNFNPSDTTDFYQVFAFGGALIRATLTVPPTHNLNLYSWKPSSAASCSSTSSGWGVSESILCNVGSTEQGYWRLEVRRMDGTGRGDYTLDFAVLGGGPERYTTDVGAANDQNNAISTPGISVGLTGWGNAATSTSPSKAVDAYRTPPPSAAFPIYRQVTANGTFYLNLHRTSSQRYNDYLFTLQYYGTQDVNVSAWNGAGWVTVATVPGQTNWRAVSFLLEHTLFYDAEPTWAGMNLKLRFEKTVQLDLISAVPWTHTTYVGHGSDDALDTYHTPGIMTAAGWVTAGMGYRNATAAGGEIIVTPPDLSARYLVRMRFDGNSSGFKVQRWTGSQWVFATSASNFTSGEAMFPMDSAWYVDALPLTPGTNVKLRLVPTDRLNETTAFAMTPVQWTTDVGVTGDNVTANHLPGFSVFPNSEWGPPTIVDTRTVRVGLAQADVYLNLPWPKGAMIGYMTYKAPIGGSGLVELWDGVAWKVVGSINGDNTWQTAVLFLKGKAVAGEDTEPGESPIVHFGAVRAFMDDYGDAFVNALVRFSVPVTLDLLWVDADPDGDNLTSFGEPNPYAIEQTTTVRLWSGDTHSVDFGAPVEGRWQVELDAVLVPGGNLAWLTASVGTSRILMIAVLSDSPGKARREVMLCAGTRSLLIESRPAFRDSAASDPVDITRVAIRRVPTDPENPDTDGDGLWDSHEGCAKRTDPTRPDHDNDGLTDWEELYPFSFNDPTTRTANVTVNVTVKAAGEYQWRIKTSGTPSGSNPVEVMVYLDGQLRWSKKSPCPGGSCTPWTNLETTFDANLPKGLHSLQVQRSTPFGSVTLALVNVTKPRFTNPLFSDTDWDGLNDGDELRGRTGWMTSPTREDTDGDGAKDGDEIRTRHTDPLLPDTDHDGFTDNSDLDPLHDLVVQVRIGKITVTPATCAQPPCRYWAQAKVNAYWTNSTDTTVVNQWVDLNHLLVVNVPDNVAAVTVRIRVLLNNQPGGSDVDIVPQTPIYYVTTRSLMDGDLSGTTTGGPGTPYASVTFSVRTFRVGKANTLLMTPNDWSTVNNGTVGGVPTGLHRYAGEQRFVFALLNVTDGHGNLASYDLERNEPNGRYTDFSGNGLHALHLGDPAIPARFGDGAKLDSTANAYIYAPDTADKLDQINDALTVSFWIRPDADYVSQSGWAWSFGRQDLWQLGFKDGKVRFEVWQATSPYTGHAVQVAYPLYAGRWYHIAAVMRRVQDPPFTFTVLDLYVGGTKVKTESWNPPFDARVGTPPLQLGDVAGGGRFKGLVDEFRLYTIPLSDDGVRGLSWFLKGSNNVIIPRGIFFDSKLYAGLNGTYAADFPLAGGTVYGNDNKVAAHLNSRILQMVFTKNATLAQASKALDLAVANKTNVVTAFPLPVTDEWYTLGLAREVDDLAANTVVENSGNQSAPPPSPTQWELFWNTLTGIASAVWNAVVAVGQFFVNVGKWLVNAFVGLYKGLVEQNWTYFKEQVLEPLRKALEAIVQFLVSLVTAAIELLLAPFKGVFADSWAASVAGAYASGYAEFRKTGTQSPGTIFQLATTLILSTLAIAIAVGIGLFALGTIMGPFAYVLALVIGVASIAIVVGLSQGKATVAPAPQAKAPNPTRTDRSYLTTLAMDVRFSTLQTESVGSEFELQSVLEWFLFFLPAIFSMLAGLAAFEVDELEFVALALILPAALVSILADAAMRYSNDQALTNRIVAGYGWFAVLGFVLDSAGLIFGIRTKSTGGVILATIGLLLGAAAWAASDHYLTTHPIG